MKQFRGIDKDIAGSITRKDFRGLAEMIKKEDKRAVSE